MNDTIQKQNQTSKSLFVHAIFHSGQFDQFIFLMMSSWVFASVVWLYIENRFILQGTAIFGTDILPFIISYLFYFIIVFGILVLFGSYKRLLKFEITSEGFALRKLIRSRNTTWNEVKFLDLSQSNAKLVTDSKTFKLSPFLAKVSCKHDVPELEDVMIGRDFTEGKLYGELLQILGEAKIIR
jgi:hypothetical protein